MRGEAKGLVIARLDGIADRDQAETLKGLRLYVPRDELPKPRRGEFYHADLVGLAAVDTGGATARHGRSRCRISAPAT